MIRQLLLCCMMPILFPTILWNLHARPYYVTLLAYSVGLDAIISARAAIAR
jgi:hypothetical protein